MAADAVALASVASSRLLHAARGVATQCEPPLAPSARERAEQECERLLHARAQLSGATASLRNAGCVQALYPTSGRRRRGSSVYGCGRGHFAAEQLCGHAGDARRDAPNHAAASAARATFASKVTLAQLSCAIRTRACALASPTAQRLLPCAWLRVPRNAIALPVCSASRAQRLLLRSSAQRTTCGAGARRFAAGKADEPLRVLRTTRKRRVKVRELSAAVTDGCAPSTDGVARARRHTRACDMTTLQLAPSCATASDRLCCCLRHQLLSLPTSSGFVLWARE